MWDREREGLHVLAVGMEDPDKVGARSGGGRVVQVRKAHSVLSLTSGSLRSRSIGEVSLERCRPVGRGLHSNAQGRRW